MANRQQDPRTFRHERAHPLRVVESGSCVYQLVWSPICNHLAFNLGKSVQIWDADRSEVVTNLPGVASPQDLCWSPNGQHLAVATKNDIHIWKPQLGRSAVSVGIKLTCHYPGLVARWC